MVDLRADRPATTVFRASAGSLIAVAALLAVLMALASLYDHFAAFPDVQAALSGITAGAKGLVIGTGVKMAMKLKPDGMALLLGGAALVAVATFKGSLVARVLILGRWGVALQLVRRTARAASYRSSSARLRGRPC